MKIALISTHLRPGGISSYIVSLANGLYAAGMDVIVVSSGGPLSKRLDKSIRHIELDIDTKCEFGLKVFRSVPKLLRILKDNDVDIIHAQTRVAQVLSGITGLLSRTAVVSTCHGYYRYSRLSRRVLPLWGQGVIAISKGVEKHLLEDFGVSRKKVYQIYNGIDVESFRDRPARTEVLRKELALPKDAVIVGSLGRFSEVKGYKYLVQACSRLYAEGRNIFLLLVGEGSTAPSLKKLASESHLKDSFRIVVPKGDVKPYLFLMDIFCLPSLQEGLGLSLMEAMASGCACVASDIGGLSELISEAENGLLSGSRDVSSIKQKIEVLLEDPGFREALGGEARKRAFERFDIKKSVELTLKMYFEITGAKNAWEPTAGEA